MGYEVVDKNGKIYGVIRYNNVDRCDISLFMSNMRENNRTLCMHSVEMWNAISYLYGYDTPTSFDEKIFNINEQLAENYSDLYHYCANISKSEAYQNIAGGVSSFFPEYSYPNPLKFGAYATNYMCTTGYVPTFIVRPYAPSEGRNESLSYFACGFVNPSMFEEVKYVPYTDEENTLLKKVRDTYVASVSTYNQATSYYDIEPQYNVLPLTAGMLNENIAIGAVGYLNAIRVGAGLNPLTYSRTLSEAAQCKSTLTVYMSANGISNPNPHYPAKPEGVDDDLYQKSKLGSGENLFMCGILNTDIIGSLTYALDDSYGSGQLYSRGHRYNLLDPSWTEIGVGNTVQQGVHKMTGNQSSNVEVVGWPSKGIMPSESGITKDTMFTCQFYNGYSSTDNTEITIRCLNTDTEWNIAKATLTKDQDFNSSGSLISYKDSTMSFGIGNVYTITFDHLVDRDGNEVSYSYRSIYTNAYVATSEDSSPESITLSENAITVELGKTHKVNAVITPDTAKNMRVLWSSDNTDVATVNENGVITAVSKGVAHITARTEANNLTATCTVNIIDKIPTKEELTENFVKRMYTVVLGRDAETEGLTVWTNALLNKQVTGAQVAELFIGGDEFTSKNTTDADYIDIVYKTMMDRESEDKGKVTWMTVLGDGMSRTFVLSQFVSSAEFTDICNRYGIDKGSVASTESRDKNYNVTCFVNRCYRYILERKGEADGLNTWTDVILTKKATVKEIAHLFLFSDEENAKGLSSTEYTYILYRAFMGREPENEEVVTMWSEHIETESLETVFDVFVDSKEFGDIVAGYGL